MKKNLDQKFSEIHEFGNFLDKVKIPIKILGIPIATSTLKEISTGWGREPHKDGNFSYFVDIKKDSQIRYCPKEFKGKQIKYNVFPKSKF
jgi:hypothetical protein